MSAIDYVRYIYYNFAQEGEFDNEFTNKWIPESDSIKVFEWALKEAISRWGYISNSSTDGLALELMEHLKSDNSIRTEGDEYTGLYHKLNVSAKDNFLKVFLAQDAVSARLARLGGEAISVALARVATELGWRAAENSQTPEADAAAVDATAKEEHPDWVVPASDRVVSRTDNAPEFEEIQGSLEDIRKTLAEDNAVGSVLGDEREIIDHEMDVAQKIVEAGRFRTSSLMGWLLRSLRYISEKFLGTAISEAAKHLWMLLQGLL